MNLKDLYLTEEQLVDPCFWKLNLACGRRLYPGHEWVNLDLEEGEGVEQCNLWDLDWPVPEGTVKYVLASHILEHVPHYYPGFEGEYWYHFFPYLLSRLTDDALLEVYGPDPDNGISLQFVGHTRHIGPRSFSEYTQPHTNFSSLENLESRQGYDVELVLLKRRKTIRLGRLNDYHFIHYLGPAWRNRVARLIGHKDELRMVFRIRRVGE